MAKDAEVDQNRQKWRRDHGPRCCTKSSASRCFVWVEPGSRWQRRPNSGEAVDFSSENAEPLSSLRSSFVRLSHLRKLLIVAGAAVAVLMAAERALAEQEPISIDYQVTENCPSKQEFLADVRFRTALLNQRDGRDTRQFVVTVKGVGDGQFLGTLRIVSPGGSSSMPREVTDASCLEVARTLALVTALAIDPRASTGPSTIGTNQSKPLGLSPQGSDSLPVHQPPLVNAPQTTPSFRASPNQWRDTTSSSSAPRLPQAPSRGVDWRWSGGMQGLGLVHVAPIPALGGGLFAEVEPRGTWIIWPDFRVAAVYAATTGSWTSSAVGDVGAKSWWLFVRAEACPGRFDTPHGELVLRFCGLLDSGVFTGTGVVIKNPQTTIREWFAVGPAIRLTLRLSSLLFADFEPALITPITRWHLTYKDSSTSPEKGLDQIRNVGESFGFSIGYRFP